MKNGLLTKTARLALEAYISSGAVLVNQKKDGFDHFHAKHALALLIAGVAHVEDGELKLTGLGALLAGGKYSEEQITRAVNCFVERGPEYP